MDGTRPARGRSLGTELVGAKRSASAQGRPPLQLSIAPVSARCRPSRPCVCCSARRPTRPAPSSTAGCSPTATDTPPRGAPSVRADRPPGRCPGQVARAPPHARDVADQGRHARQGRQRTARPRRRRVRRGKGRGDHRELAAVPHRIRNLGVVHPPTRVAASCSWRASMRPFEPVPPP